ncbi:MAG: hypothetical protein AB8F94_20245 [Saprospiraceae bacterium]
MKHFILLLFFTLGFYNIAFTQSENNVLKNEWSVNINFFVNELFLAKDIEEEEDIIGYQAPIESLLTYRRYLNNNFVWQMGVSLYSKNSEIDFFQGFGGNQSQSKKGYYLRTGFQKYYHLSDKVKFYLGTDLLLSFQKYKAFIDFEDSGVFFEGNYTHINREKEIGLVPHLGFRWQVNSRVSFSTETNLIASYVFFDIDLDSPFSSEPILLDNRSSLQKDSEKRSFRFQQPIVLLFNLKF